MNPPTIWATMYPGTCDQGKLPMAARPMVTAGLRCAPLIRPTEYTANATATPHPKVITIQPLFWPLVRLRTTFATTPSPSRTSSIVPIASARSVCMRGDVRGEAPVESSASRRTPSGGTTASAGGRCRDPDHGSRTEGGALTAGRMPAAAAQLRHVLGFFAVFRTVLAEFTVWLDRAGTTRMSALLRLIHNAPLLAGSTPTIVAQHTPGGATECTGRGR